MDDKQPSSGSARRVAGRIPILNLAKIKKILFVEDNQVLLELYDRLLADERDRWETALAADGETALRLLRQTDFDVVVSDMEMPGMSGIELLTEVRNLHPQTSRVLISGFADQAMAAQSLNCTHLFIPKPFDAKLLRSTLARITSLDAYLGDDKLRGLVGRMGALPSFPTVYLEIMREIESPTSPIQGVADIISRDPAIAAKVLQVANSVAYGATAKIHDPAEAVQRLGMNTVRSLALSAQVYGKLTPVRLHSFSAEGLWAHLMKCGTLARAILGREQADFAEMEDAFIAGMLHDIGKLMLADCLPGEYTEALKLAEREHLPLSAAEVEVFGAAHAGVAAYLLGLWGMPTGVVEAVAFHATPEKSGLKKCGALTAVHVADALCDPTLRTTLNLEYLAEIGVVDRLECWREAAAESQLEAPPV
jgi:HD-like signal output (HDOD) protein/CheY-like chemotaxis protein